MDFEEALQVIIDNTDSDKVLQRRFIQAGCTWEEYEKITKIISEQAPGVRLSYCDGEIEIKG